MYSVTAVKLAAFIASSTPENGQFASTPMGLQNPFQNSPIYIP
jgi:hypothetical protein